MRSSEPRIGVVVDAYSTGRHLAGEFAEYEIRLVHVQSMAEILPFDRPSFRPGDFVRNLVYENAPEAVTQTLAELRPLFVIPGCESGVLVADALAEHLGLAGNGTLLSWARRDKHAMGEAVAAAGLRAIRQLATDDPAAARAFRAAQAPGEVVIKPLDSAGTEDVYFCSDDAQIEAAFAAILGKVNGMGTMNLQALVQERIIGRQFTANLVSVDGVHHLAELWSYETVLVPGAGSLCDHERLLDGSEAEHAIIAPYARDVLDALGIRNGPAHMELFIDATGPVLVEVGARLQGSMSRKARSAALGYDHVSLTALRYAQPEAFRAHIAANTPFARRKHAVIVSVLSDREGVVLGHSGLAALRDWPSFADAFGFPAIGERVYASRDLSSTAGIVYLVHEEAEVVEADRLRLKSLTIDAILDLAPHTQSAS